MASQATDASFASGFSKVPEAMLYMRWQREMPWTLIPLYRIESCSVGCADLLYRCVCNVISGARTSEVVGSFIQNDEVYMQHLWFRKRAILAL